MKLSEFVSDTLVEIMDGVVSAQRKWTEGGQKGHINPLWGGYAEASKNIREVSFDVAVTVSESTTGGAKAGIKVVGIGGLGGNLQTEVANSKVSRIAFTIPIAPPIIFIDIPEGATPKLDTQ